MSRGLIIGLSVAAAVLLLFSCLFSARMRRLVGTLLNSLLGLGLLVGSNMLGSSFAVAVNIPTILISLILGLPGVAALFLLRVILKL